MGWTKSPTLSDVTVKAKYPVPYTVNKWGTKEYVLTQDITKELKRLYPIKTNLELMGLFGIGLSTLLRFRTKLGLVKNDKVIKRKQCEAQKKTCEENGYYDRLRGHKPSPQCMEGMRKWWADGNHPLKIMKKKNSRKYQKYLKENGQRRSALYAEERRRVEIGFNQKTNLHIPQFSYTRKQVCHRSNAMKRGYICGDYRENMGERYTIFYNQETERSALFEKNLTKDGFTVKQLPEPKKHRKSILIEQ